MGYYRAALDITAVSNEEFGPHTGAYSEEELHEKVKKLPMIKYFAEPEENGPGGISKIGLSARLSTQVRLHWDEKYA